VYPWWWHSRLKLDHSDSALTFVPALMPVAPIVRRSPWAAHAAAMLWAVYRLPQCGIFG